MHIIFVYIKVKPDFIDQFILATKENVKYSIQEPGISRFEFYQQIEDPTKFTLLEVYKDPQDQVSHRETSHYQRWRDTVTDMMAEPRQGISKRQLLPN